MEDNKEITLDNFRKDENFLRDFVEFFMGIKLRNYQVKFIQKCLTQKRIIGVWSRQSGKSTSVAIYCILRMLFEPSTVMIIAPTLNQSSELFLKIRTIAEGSVAISTQIQRSTQTELILKNGSRTKSLPLGTDGKTIRGYSADDIILEEAQGIPDAVVNAIIMPMIASKGNKGKVIKIGTPLKRSSHFYRSAFTDPNYSLTQVTWEDGVREGQYTIEFIEEQRKNITDIQFRSEYCGEFIDELASFFPLELIETCQMNYHLIKVY